VFDSVWRWSLENVIFNAFWRDVAVAVVIFLLFLLARGLFVRFIFRMILGLTSKTKTDLDNAILLAFESPLKSFLLILGIYLALLYLPLSANAGALLTTIFRSFIIFFAAWGVSNLTSSALLKEYSSRFSIDQILIDFLMKVVKIVVLVLAALMIAQQWGFDVEGFIAGLGLGGLAFALAAKDAVANIFGGIIIIMDKPFSVGDWIYTPSVEGTVEEMSFRSTKIRTFAHALVTVPNSAIANEPITNWSRMGKRRITFKLGVTYGTPPERLQRSIDAIRAMLENHPAIHKETIFVHLDEFGESSLNIFLYFFTITTRWGEYLAVKEEINFRILKILEEEQVQVALPSRSIYIEKTGE
jgi:MscS family membrane protein